MRQMIRPGENDRFDRFSAAVKGGITKAAAAPPPTTTIAACQTDDGDDGDDAYPMPSMVGSSVAELEHVAQLGSVLHACGLVQEPMTPRALAGMLLAGKAVLSTDARLDLAAVGIDMLFEYDPGFCHGDVERDVRKTRRLWALCPDALVVRLRTGAEPLPLPNDARLLVVRVDNRNATVAAGVAAVAHALAERVAEPHKTRLLGVRARSHDVAKRAASALRVRMDSAHADGILRIYEVVGDEEVARRVMATDGIKTRVADGSVVECLRRLQAPPYSVKSLRTFVCNGVAAKFDDPGALFAILDRLIAPPYSVKSLQTFVCGGVAAKFDDPEALFAVLDELQARIHPRAIDIVSCNDAFASRMHRPGFVDAVVRCADRLGAVGVDVPTEMRKVLHKSNSRLMDKLDKLHARIMAIDDGRRMGTFLATLYENSSTRKALKQTIDAW